MRFANPRMGTATRAALCLPFPMVDFIAQVVIPRELSQYEADRLCAFVQALVMPPEALRANKPPLAELMQRLGDLPEISGNIQGAGGETEQPLGNQAQALRGGRCSGPTESPSTNKE